VKVEKDYEITGDENLVKTLRPVLIDSGFIDRPEPTEEKKF
jgi:hypothetical protein